MNFKLPGVPGCPLGPRPKAKKWGHKGILIGLEGLFLAGIWLMPPGGLPGAAVTGKWAVQRICKKEGKEFRF